MEGVNASHRRSFDYAALINLDPISPSILTHFSKVYLSIFFVTLSTICGACLHFAAEIGGWCTLLGFLGSVICFVMAFPSKEDYFSHFLNIVFVTGGMWWHWSNWYIPLGLFGSVIICVVMRPKFTEAERLGFVMVGAFLFGASVLPWVQPVLNICPRVFIASLVGRALCFWTFWLGATVASDRSYLYVLTLLLSYQIVLIWLVVAINLFENAAEVTLVFLELLLFPLHLVVYSQEMVVKAHREVNFLDSAIGFLADYSIVSIKSLVLVVRRVFG